MPSTVIRFEMTLEGDLGSFDDAERARLEDELRAQLDCYEPVCYLTVRLSSASVRVQAEIAIPDGTGDDTQRQQDAVANVQHLADDLRTTTTLDGRAVVAVSEVELTAGVSVPLAVEQDVSSSSGSGGGGGMAIGVAAAVVVLIVVGVAFWWTRQTRKRKASLMHLQEYDGKVEMATAAKVPYASAIVGGDKRGSTQAKAAGSAEKHTLVHKWTPMSAPKSSDHI